MDPVFENEILAVIARTKIHKDTFAIPGLIRILQSELEKHSGDEAALEDTVVVFVERVTEALASSPIYSDPLVRELLPQRPGCCADRGRVP